MDICQKDLMLSSDEEEEIGGGNDDGIPEEVLEELMEKSDPESGDDDSSECSSSSGSSEGEGEDDIESASQKKKKDEEESEESIAKGLEELLETVENLQSSCSSFDDEHEPGITVKASTPSSSRRRKVFTKKKKKKEKCATNNALPSSLFSSNKVQSTLTVHEYDDDDCVSYSSGSYSSEEDVAVMKSISDDNGDSDSDFDPERKVFTKKKEKKEKCATNNALPSSLFSSNKIQSTLAVHEDDDDDCLSYSSGSSSSEEDVDVMKSVSDDDDDSDSDFDPDVVLEQMEENKDASEDTASVISTGSSTATWSSLLSCRKNSNNNRKRRKLDTDTKFVRLSQTTLSINALKDEFSLSLGSLSSSLSFSSLSSRSSKLATAIVERASKTSDNARKKQQQQQAKYENFSNVTSMPPPAVMRSKRITSAASSNISIDRYGYKPQLTPDVEFVNEIKTVIAIYISLVFLQRAMNNKNNNSICYCEDMVRKMIGIINNIAREEMPHEKYQSVVRDALYIYCIVVSKLTGPEHLKRLRTPKQQSKFCYMIAMMVNNLPIDSDLSLAGKSTNLVQFASGMSDPAYRMAVRNLSSVFNNSYSVNKALKLPPSYLVMVNQILSILSSKNTSLCERKPRTLAQSAYLYYDHGLRDSLRSSGLTSEESSLGAAVRMVSQQLAVDGIDEESLEDGLCIAAGKLDVDGAMLKSLGGGQKDIKIIGLSTLLTQRFRKEARTIAIT
uniref:Wsv282-like protein n=1 Tax=Hemigrapsus takanoi nimavirus TaxID=2133792 RepID=A0A401IP12_9VIRU|nr:wsv282-like protein [Hemigrapsus takanoi nimavirus]